MQKKNCTFGIGISKLVLSKQSQVLSVLGSETRCMILVCHHQEAQTFPLILVRESPGRKFEIWLLAEKMQPT